MGAHERGRTGDSRGTRRLPRTEAFDILGNDRRRYAVGHLLTAGATDVGELAERVAAREYDVPREAVDTDQRHRVYATLQQTHLPRLEEAGVVRDGPDGVVLTERGRELQRYLDRTRDDGWEPLYVGLAVLSATAFVVATAVQLARRRSPGSLRR